QYRIPCTPARRSHPLYLHPFPTRRSSDLSFDGGNAHGDDAPHARFPHGREFGTCHVADHGRWSAAFRGHNRDHCVLPADCASNVLEVSTVSVDYHPQSGEIGQCAGTPGERCHRTSTPDAFFEYEATPPQ